MYVCMHVCMHTCLYVCMEVLCILFIRAAGRRLTYKTSSFVIQFLQILTSILKNTENNSHNISQFQHSF